MTITIDEAKEVLAEMRNINMNYYSPKRKAALKLGIEALEFKKAIRAHTVDDFDALLPGETEE